MMRYRGSDTTYNSNPLSLAPVSSGRLKKSQVTRELGPNLVSQNGSQSTLSPAVKEILH